MNNHAGDAELTPLSLLKKLSLHDLPNNTLFWLYSQGIELFAPAGVSVLQREPGGAAGLQGHLQRPRGAPPHLRRALSPASPVQGVPDSQSPRGTLAGGATPGLPGAAAAYRTEPGCLAPEPSPRPARGAERCWLGPGPPSAAAGHRPAWLRVKLGRRCSRRCQSAGGGEL